MVVESADKHSPGKLHRFLGICVQRKGCGLRANFTLRNVIEDQVMKLYFFYFCEISVILKISFIQWQFNTLVRKVLTDLTTVFRFIQLSL